MDKGSVPESQDASPEGGDDCPTCGYTPRQKDRHFVDEFGVWHVRCYRCGSEWVE